MQTVYTTVFNGKTFDVEINATNLSAFTDSLNTFIDIVLPSGLQFHSVILPGATTYNNATKKWTIGTLEAATTETATFTFIVTDVEALGSTAVISWEIDNALHTDSVSTNNNNSFTIIAINCEEISSCADCGAAKLYYPCKSFDVEVELNNDSDDIQENILVRFATPSAPAGFAYKHSESTVSLGTLTSEDSGGLLTTLNIVDGLCSGFFEPDTVWRIPVLPANTVATLTLKVYVIDNGVTVLENCEVISWQVEEIDDETSPLFNLIGTFNLKNYSYSDLQRSLGYLEWAGRLVYSLTPISTPLGPATGFVAVPFNRGSFNYLGDITFEMITPGQFTITGANLFAGNVILSNGTHHATSEMIEISTVTSTSTIDFSTAGLVDEIDNTVTIRVYF